jgi:hypothetical protein
MIRRLDRGPCTEFPTYLLAIGIRPRPCFTCTKLGARRLPPPGALGKGGFLFYQFPHSPPPRNSLHPFTRSVGLLMAEQPIHARSREAAGCARCENSPKVRSPLRVSHRPITGRTCSIMTLSLHRCLLSLQLECHSDRAKPQYFYHIDIINYTPSVSPREKPGPARSLRSDWVGLKSPSTRGYQVSVANSV